MLDLFLYPGVAAIWRKNLNKLPVETRHYMERASDMLIAEMARDNPAVKRQLIKLWLEEVAYDSESRRHHVNGCRPTPWPEGCVCAAGYGHKHPSVKWTDLSSQSTVFDVIVLRHGRTNE